MTSAVEEAHGGVAVLINNVGYGEIGSLEEVPIAALWRQFETKVVGAKVSARVAGNAAVRLSDRLHPGWSSNCSSVRTAAAILLTRSGSAIVSISTILPSTAGWSLPSEHC